MSAPLQPPSGSSFQQTSLKTNARTPLLLEAYNPSFLEGRKMEEVSKSSEASGKPLLTECGDGSNLFLQLQEVISSLETCAWSWRSPSVSDSVEDSDTLSGNTTPSNDIFPSTVIVGLNQEPPPIFTHDDQHRIQSEISRYREQNAALKIKLRATDKELDRLKVTLREFLEEKDRLQVKVETLEDALQDSDTHPHHISSPSSPVSGKLLNLTSESPFSLSISPSWQTPLYTLQSLIQYLQSLSGIQPSLPPTSEVHPRSHEREIESLKGNVTGRLLTKMSLCFRQADHMKQINNQLCAILEECKTDSEKLSMQLGKLESNCTALRLALQSSERCLKTYSVLLALAEAKEELLLGQVSGEDFFSSGWSLLPKDLEIKTKLFMMEVKKALRRDGLRPEAEKGDSKSPAKQRFYAPWLSEEEEQILKDYIQSLKLSLMSARLMGHQPLGQDGTSHTEEGTHLVDIIKAKVDTAIKASVEASQSRPEKPVRAHIVQELMRTRESLSELRASLQLLQTEKKALELLSVSHVEQEKAYLLIRDQLQEELNKWAEHKGVENSGGDVNKYSAEEKYTGHEKQIWEPGEPSPATADMQHLLESITRSNEMMVRVESLTSELDKLSCRVHVQQTQSSQVITDFFKAHRNLFCTYQNARKKYQEQQRRLESQIGLMSQRHRQQLHDLMQSIQRLQGQQVVRDTGETSL
ncbi:harmonin-binding protein USHBP1 [Rhinophrynus dorsalis]